ncbi:MAG: FAD-binding protein [Coriobacteriales bacterium]|jgi:hypothetical protein|nr:FAD-binding protein [Coriobacteriales bacterium]
MGKQKETLSRRSFLQGAGIFAAGAAVVGLAGCATETAADATARNANLDYLPEIWDYETDVLIVGFGGAGIAAATALATENLGEFIVIEAAPKEGEGGNTRVSANLLLIPESVDGAVTYQTALNGAHTVEKELIQGWAENLCENKEWLEGLGIELVQMNAYSPEFPEIEGSEFVRTYCADGIMGKNSLWNAMKDLQEELGYKVLHDTRGLELYRNPMTNEALGLRADQDGTTISIKARKGIVLCCGGFENNPDMCKDYLGVGQSKHPLGTPYNRGDGFKMVEPFGAKLWHMNNAAGSALATWGQGLDVGVNSTSLGYSKLPLHSYLFIGHDGKRFMYEETSMINRHGKVLSGGVFVDLPTPENAWAVFDETFFTNVPISSQIESLVGWPSTHGTIIATDNQGFFDAGVIVKADTIKELAELINVPLATLEKTLEAYNGYVASGHDPDWRRGEVVYDATSGMGTDTVQSADGEPVEAVAPFAITPVLPPYYATPLPGSILNTQGGPKRNKFGQVLGNDDVVIDRLYGAGEFGAIYSYMYNGGGNVSDAIASGRAAARHAASLTPWDAK